MANISITTACNRNCAYCFAKPAGPRGGRRDAARTAGETPALQSGAGGGREGIRPEDFAQVLDLLERSGVREARLLGGEPTLHPDFPALVALAAARKFSIMVFSNGLMPETALAALAALPAAQCAVLLNVPCPLERPAAEREQFERTGRTLGARAQLGINLYRPGLPLVETLDVIGRLGLKRSIRLGLAHPRLNGNNASLHPQSYRLVGRDIVAFLRQAQPRGVELTLDCGFVPCMFPPEFYELTKGSAGDFGNRCGPIPDVLPDLTSVHCYALAEQERYPISGVREVGDLARLQTQQWSDIRRLGVFRDCPDCELRKDGRCCGGCLAASVNRLNGAHRSMGVSPMSAPAPETRVPRADVRWVAPYVDQPAAFWRELAALHPGRIAEAYFPLPDEGIGSGRPVQPSAHLDEFLRQDAVAKSVLINPIALPAPLDEIGPRIVDAVARLSEEHGIVSATVRDIGLAERIRRRLPSLKLVASVLMEVCEPDQAAPLNGLFDVLVPSSAILRSRPKLLAVKRAFAGALRLLVNEACLPKCAFRRQHFHEMAFSNTAPASLCDEVLEREPWRRLTGAWVLPQHLYMLDDVADEFKLAGRGTLHDPRHYRSVLAAYLHRTALWPPDIGGGPASLLRRMTIPDRIFRQMLHCSTACDSCRLCQRLYGATADISGEAHDG